MSIKITFDPLNRTQTGSIGALYVHPDYRRRGYGSLVVRAISKIIGERGDDVIACVDEPNTPARKLFEKLGFSVVGTVRRVVTNPIFPYEWMDRLTCFVSGLFS